MVSVEAWVIVRHYYNHNDCGTGKSAPQCFILTSPMEYGCLKSRIKSYIGLPEDGNEIVKLRRADGSLLPLSFLLGGNTKHKPYFIDVTRPNQNVVTSERSALPPSYANSVRGKLATLEQRIERVEALVPELQSRRHADIERTLDQLGSKVQFLDKRLDELMPLDWKKHFELEST